MPTTAVYVHVTEDGLTRLKDIATLRGKSVETATSQLLSEALRLLPATGRAVVVTGEDLEVLEGILGSGSVLNSQDLREKVERLAGISFQHVRLPMTPSMLEQLERKAKGAGLTVEQLVERTAPRIYEQFFDLISRTI